MFALRKQQKNANNILDLRNLFANNLCLRSANNKLVVNMNQMPMILEDAIEQWEINTHTQAQVTETPKDEVDAIMEFTHNGENRKVFIEIKKEVRNHQLPELEMLAKSHSPLMVVAENIFPKIKEVLREKGIAYLETSGNIYYKDKGLFIWLDGKKPIKSEEEKLGRAFTKTGLKAVFHFLLKPDLVNATYRTIADVTGISFGNINFIMTDLKQQGYLLKVDNNSFKLVKRKELLTKWMDNYEQKLKPSLLVGIYRFLNNTDALRWKSLQLENKKSWWGGEPGGELITNNLQPESFTLYTVETKTEIIKKYRFLPDPNGNIKVYNKFWNIDEANENVAPPLLIYIDLMITGDRRNRETAQKIYDQFLQNEF